MFKIVWPGSRNQLIVNTVPVFFATEADAHEFMMRSYPAGPAYMVVKSSGETEMPKAPGKGDKIMKHTPGPWRVETQYHEEEGFEQYIKSQEIVHWDGECSYVLARINWSNPVEGNAYLMAAAPDLLKACKAILAEHEKFCETCGENCDDCSINEVMKLVIVAIVKTECYAVCDDI